DAAGCGRRTCAEGGGRHSRRAGPISPPRRQRPGRADPGPRRRRAGPKPVQRGDTRMGFALIWAEGLAVALLALALAVAFAARGRALRWLWVAVVILLFLAPAVLLVLFTFDVRARHGALVRTTWFGYSASWLVAFLISSVLLLRMGLRRTAPGLARPA